MDEIIYIIDNENKGVRIDKFLSNKFEGKSRSFIQGLIEDEGIVVNNKKVKSNYKLKENDEIKINMPEPTELQVKAQDIPIDIIYEDKDVIVVNKPKGMVVHPAPGNYEGTLVNALLYHCTDLSSINGVIRPGIVHRIDKDTTGILVVAKNDEAHNKLSDQLKEHTMKREYYALVEGRIKQNSGTIDKPLARSKKDRLKIAITPDGKRAVTHYEVLERFRNATLIKCVLETGRTHQIRVHFESIGCPLLGDELYGGNMELINRQALHSYMLEFDHPFLKKHLIIRCKLPNDMESIVKEFKKIN